MAEDISISIPGYRIERVLGEGGMAKVYLAVQDGFDRPVALKVISPQLAVDEEFGRRFLREARIVGNLAHANIVPVYDVGEKDGLYYLSMEILPGGDLKAKLADGVSPEAALEITEQVARALKYAQGKGFIHRDVKPDNVLFRDDGTAVLTDFGIARPENDSADVTQITQIRAVIGSPKYMSPEQAMGEKLDARTDIYSLGIMLYEMLSGSVPYHGRNITEISLQRAERHSPELPAGFGRLQTLTNRMLAYDRDTRYQNYDDLLTDIGALRIALSQGNAQEEDADATVIYTPPGIQQAAPANKAHSSKRPQLIAGLLFVLALAGIGAWYLNSASTQSAEDIIPTADSAAGKETDNDIAGNQEFAGVRTNEYFAFLDALDAGTAAATEGFLSAHPDSLLGDILKVKVLGNEELVEQLGQQAQANNARAQLILSELYGNGWGVEKNFQLSKQWAGRAAESEQPFAQFQYADLLIDAKTGGNEDTAISDADLRVAVSDLKNSASAGLFLAQTQLAYQLLVGEVIERDVAESIRLLESAARQDDRNAAFLLGQILDGGINIEGLPKPDTARAQVYFRQAAQLGHKDAGKFVE